MNPRRLFAAFGVSAMLLAAGAYALGCAFQERLIFPRAYELWPVPAGPTDPEVERMWITADDGSRVEAWFKTGRRRSVASPGSAVIYFHGNGDLIDTRWSAVEAYVSRGISAMAVEYRGYGRSGGSPSQQAIVADSIRFYDLLMRRPEVDPNRIIFHGLSIGGGVAAAVAEHRRPAAMVLECTFLSIEALAERWLMPASTCRHPFRTDRVLAGLDLPVLILQGRRDDLIPVQHGRELHKLARRSTYVELDCGHADWRTDWPSIEAFLTQAGFP